jgi:PAS domain S-box-containing protein
MVADVLRVRAALENGEFVPFFQPLIEIRSGELAGYEVLARWEDPERGTISPETFIPAAERDGWINDLTMELLKRAFDAVAGLPAPVQLSVNLSAGQLCDRSLPGAIERVANGFGFGLERLTLELTESALVHDMAIARAVAADLKALGCKLALDDFGTGFSSLLSLQALPFDRLKVDRSFVGSMIESKDSRKIVAMVIGLGQSLGIATVAEGVETAEQDEMLLWLGCDYGQGWLFGRPVPAAGLLETFHAVRERKASAREGEGMPQRQSMSQLDMPPAMRLAQLRAVYDGAPVGLAFLDRDMRYVTLNKRLADMSEVPMEEHLSKTVEEIYPHFFGVVGPSIRRALEGESVGGIEVETHPWKVTEGRSLLLSCEPARDEAGEVVGVSVAMSDLTPMKRLERSRQEAEDHLRYFLDLNPQIAWVLDEKGCALDVSKRWLSSAGREEGAWKGLGWLEALHPDDVERTKCVLFHSLATGEPMDVRYRLRPEGGEWIWKWARGWPRYDGEGKILYWYGVLEACEGLE